MIIVVIGAAGAGKTTVGRALAVTLGWTFHDADDLHTPENRERMHRGEALTDALRQPWLDRVRAILVHATERGGNAVVDARRDAAHRRPRRYDPSYGGSVSIPRLAIPNRPLVWWWAPNWRAKRARMTLVDERSRNT